MTKRLNKLHIILAILIALATVIGIILIGSISTSAEERNLVGITMPTVFDDNMVFQRGEEINIFGYSDKEGAQIEAILGDARGTATVTNGEWLITLPGMDATFGLTLTVNEVGGMGSKQFKDVAVGEVFLVSGQSNAALEACELEDIDEQMALIGNYENLRLYSTPGDLRIEESKLGLGSWHKASRSVITGGSEGAENRFSAIGLIVGMRLCDELGPDVPVAVMYAARGASKIRAWLSYETLLTVAPDEAAKVATEKTYYKNNGTWSATAGSKPHTTLGTVCYNGVIAPLEHFKVKGVIWHQGEGDVEGECFGTTGSGYRAFFTALVNSWREHFDSPDMSFYMVQIGAYDLNISDEVSEFKAEQYDIATSLDNVYLVPTGFDDCAFTLQDAIAGIFIHPARKSPLGNRIASVIIEAQFSGDEVTALSSLPMVEAIYWKSNYTYVRFTTPIGLAYGTMVKGFEQYNGTGWSSINGEICGDNEIRFYSRNKAPKIVRYGFGNPEVELDSGDVYKLASYSTVGEKEKTKSITLSFVGGGSITFEPNDGTVIRMKNAGNLVGASGAPVPVFQLECGYEL